MTKFEIVKDNLKSSPKSWLITGVAGFIGSNLLLELLKLNQTVVGIDNLSTGAHRNLDEIKNKVSIKQWSRFQFFEIDISAGNEIEKHLKNIDYLLHQAALGSVPRSIKDPINSNNSNVTGFLNVLNAARTHDIKGFTYASSSSTYGDYSGLPKFEEKIGKPLSPYALTKRINEMYAEIFANTYGYNTIGLRYFNVFGERQDPEGPYAAVIPKWIKALIDNDEVFINGDGSTSRDFCYVHNVVQMNILSACAPNEVKNQIYNVANGHKTTLLDLHKYLVDSLKKNNVNCSKEINFRDFRDGDIKHSMADISKAKKMLGYSPEFDLKLGIDKAMPWYLNFLK